MKTLIYTFCIAFLFPLVIFAQDNETSDKQTKQHKFYINIGKGISLDGKLFGVGLNSIYSNNWGFSLSYNHLGTVPEGLPSNYTKSGITNNLNTFSFRILKEFSTKTKLIRFGVEAGPSLISYELADLRKYNTPSSNYNSSNGNYNNSNSGNGGFPGGGFFDGPIINSNIYGLGTSGSFGPPNNKDHKLKQETVGLSLRAKVEFPLTKVIGIELAATSNINKLKSYVGGEIHLTIGLVRGKL